MGVSKNSGTPKSSILIGFIMETPIKMDDLGVPLFLETHTYMIYDRMTSWKFS